MTGCDEVNTYIICLNWLFSRGTLDNKRLKVTTNVFMEMYNRLSQEIMVEKLSDLKK